jgi:hypothetical protein
LSVLTLSRDFKD